MAQKRSLLDRIFGRRPPTAPTVQRLELITGYGSIFTEWAGEPYAADAVRSAVDAIARNAARFTPRHIRRSQGTPMPVDSKMERVLAMRPNRHMSAYDFLYKVVTTLLVDNNAFVYPQWDGDQLVAVWPISCMRAEFLADAAGATYVRFWFRDGRDRVLPYPEVIHLRRHFYRSEVAGDDNNPLNTALNAIKVTNEGLARAVQSSANLRGLLKFAAILKPDDLKRERDKFVADYLDVSNSGGVAALDSKAEYIELKSDPKMVNAAQMKELRETVYRYFGVNEAIVTSHYTEDQWTAFYESILEPLAVQMSLEFTEKLFTERERGHGNEIVFESNRLQYASAKTKLDLITVLSDRGLLTVNEGRELFGLGPVEDGDRRIVSLNYVNADKADQYQLGEGDNDAGDGQEGSPARGAASA